MRCKTGNIMNMTGLTKESVWPLPNWGKKWVSMDYKSTSAVTVKYTYVRLRNVILQSHVHHFFVITDKSYTRKKGYYKILIYMVKHLAYEYISMVSL